MNSFSIAFKLFKTNIKTYGYYLVVLVFAVAVYYDFLMLKHSPEVLKTQSLISDARAASGITSFVLLVTLIFFMWYSSSFFLKQRKKEIGIYSLMGISNGKIGLVFAVESIFLGITALGTGLLVGILLSKLFVMALAKAVLLKVAVEFSVPLGAVKEVVITFGIIFLILSVRNFISVARSRLIDLISDARKEEGIPKFKVVRGILAVIFIGTGYYLSIDSFMSVNFPLIALVVVILVVMGTYWLFGALLSLIMRFLIGRKKVMYRGARIVSISNIAFRLRANYRSLAMLAVMAAATITAFGTALSLQYYVDRTHSIQFPYSFSFISADKTLNQRVAETIEKSQHQLLLKEQISYLEAESVLIDGDRHKPSSGPVVKYSDFVRITGDLKVKNDDELVTRLKVSENEAIYIDSPRLIGSIFNYKGMQFSMGGKEYVYKDHIKTPLFGDGTLGSSSAIIVDDGTYESLKKKYNEKVFNGFLVSNPEESIKLAQDLMNIVPKVNSLFTYVGMYEYKFRFIGLFFFLGTFMSVVFILATGSIMYFKLLSEGLADKDKYEMLSKIGMTKDEIRRAISMQVGLSLILPLLVGIVHSMFAINVLGGLLNFNLIIPTLGAILVFTSAYGVFYVATKRSFLKMVCYGIEN